MNAIKERIDACSTLPPSPQSTPSDLTLLVHPSSLPPLLRLVGRAPHDSYEAKPGQSTVFSLAALQSNLRVEGHWWRDVLSFPWEMACVAMSRSRVEEWLEVFF